MTGEALWQDWGEEGAQSAGETAASTDGAVVSEIEAIEAKMGTQEYIRNEGMQARLRELYAARQTGAVPSPAAAGERERAEIERVMRTDPKRYYRDEQMQARYRELLEDEAAGDAGPDSGAGLIDLPSAAEWTKAGGDGADLGHRMDIARTANDILVGIPERERIALGHSFDGLPQSVQGAAFAALGDRSAVSAYPLAEEAIAELRQVPAYAGLIREWGSDAPRKLAVAQERLWRLLDRLNDTEARQAVAWIDGLPKAAMAALTKQMAR